MAATEGNGFSVRAQPARVRVAPGEYLGCPNCSSTDLKKVSLAYQEGLFYTVARTRLPSDLKTSQTRWPLQHHQPKSPARVATMAATEGNGFSVRAQPARVRVAPGEYLGCPNCSSTDLKKVSLAYQEGLFYSVARTRLR